MFLFSLYAPSYPKEDMYTQKKCSCVDAIYLYWLDISTKGYIKNLEFNNGSLYFKSRIFMSTFQFITGSNEFLCGKYGCYVCIKILG